MHNLVEIILGEYGKSLLIFIKYYLKSVCNILQWRDVILQCKIRCHFVYWKPAFSGLGLIGFFLASMLGNFVLWIWALLCDDMLKWSWLETDPDRIPRSLLLWVLGVVLMRFREQKYEIFQVYVSATIK